MVDTQIDLTFDQFLVTKSHAMKCRNQLTLICLIIVVFIDTARG
jgi:hypothetical protein